jgi:uncharacterized protein with FMN-binding domain/NAD-dependent dihydropyrimidine dehydrogenase PreA subunit
MKNFKWSITQIIRHIIQIISFILFPGLFILAWNSIESIYTSILGGTFTFQGMLSQILILLSIIPITFLWGRFFCGYLCAFGSMQEFLSFIGEKLKIKKVTINYDLDKFLKYIKYILLVFFIILWTLKVSIDTSFNPWNIFGIYSSYKGWSNLSYLLSFGGVLLLLIIISSLFVERIFCRYFCPLGGIFAIISKPRLYKIKKSSNKCINCNLCSKKCAMGIDVNAETNKYGKVKSGECIDCFKCINICNSKALYTNPKEAISGTAAAIAISGLYYAGTITTNTNYSIENITGQASISNGKYIDGTYEGTAQGYRGATTVQVKVSNGNISSITIESYKDDDQFFNKAKSTIINEIISNQSTNIQTVSGATYSSKGIIEAVANALSSSTQMQNTNTINNSSNTTNTNKNSTTQNTTTKNSTNSTTSSNSTSSSVSSFSEVADGTYEGTGNGKNGSIKVSVVAKNGKVTSITIESYKDDEQYFSRAKSTIISEIVSNQSINVQTVSGATMSSNGIIEAVANALGISYSNSNSNIQNSKSSHGRM